MFTCKLFPGRTFKKVAEIDKAEKERKEARDLLEKLRRRMGQSKVVTMEKTNGKTEPAQTSQST